MQKLALFSNIFSRGWQFKDICDVPKSSTCWLSNHSLMRIIKLQLSVCSLSQEDEEPEMLHVVHLGMV